MAPAFEGDLLGKSSAAPAYSVTYASRLVKISPWRAKRWLAGYQYRYSVRSGSEKREGRQPPVVHRKRDLGRTYASFIEVIDLLFVREFLEQGVSLQKLRRALNEAEERLDKSHFAHEVFFTNGKEIFLRLQQTDIILLLSGGQWAMPPVIEQLAHRIDFDETTKIARRWHPLGKDIPIVIDPLVSFGRPAIEGKGIATANVFDLFKAEGENLQAASSWLGVSDFEAEAAIGFERQLAA